MDVDLDGFNDTPICITIIKSEMELKTHSRFKIFATLMSTNILAKVECKEGT